MEGTRESNSDDPFCRSCYWTSKWRQQVRCASVELKGIFPGGLRAREIWEPVFSSRWYVFKVMGLDYIVQATSVAKAKGQDLCLRPHQPVFLDASWLQAPV